MADRPGKVDGDEPPAASTADGIRPSAGAPLATFPSDPAQPPRDEFVRGGVPPSPPAAPVRRRLGVLDTLAEWLDRLKGRGVPAPAVATPGDPQPVASPPPDRASVPRQADAPGPAGSPSAKEPSFVAGEGKVTIHVPAGSFEKVRELFEEPHADIIARWISENSIGRFVIKIKKDGGITVQEQGGGGKKRKELSLTSPETFLRLVGSRYPIAVDDWPVDLAQAKSTPVELRDYSRTDGFIVRAGGGKNVREVFFEGVLFPQIERDLSSAALGIGETLRFLEQWSNAEIMIVVGDGGFGARLLEREKWGPTKLYAIQGDRAPEWETVFPKISREVVEKRLGPEITTLAGLRQKVAAEDAAREARARYDHLVAEEREAERRRVRELLEAERNAGFARERAQRGPFKEAGWTASFPPEDDFPEYQPSEFEQAVTEWKRQQYRAPRPSEGRKPVLVSHMEVGRSYAHGNLFLKVDVERGALVLRMNPDEADEPGSAFALEDFYRRAQDLAKRGGARAPVQVVRFSKDLMSPLEILVSGDSERALAVVYEALTGRFLRDHPRVEPYKDGLIPYSGEWGDALMKGEYLIRSRGNQPAIGSPTMPLLVGRGTFGTPIRVTPWATVRPATTRKRLDDDLGPLIEVALHPSVVDAFLERVRTLADYEAHEEGRSYTNARLFRVSFTDDFTDRQEDKVFDWVAALLYELRPKPGDDVEAPLREVQERIARERQEGESRLAAARAKAERLEAIARGGTPLVELPPSPGIHGFFGEVAADDLAMGFHPLGSGIGRLDLPRHHKRPNWVDTAHALARMRGRSAFAPAELRRDRSSFAQAARQGESGRVRALESERGRGIIARAEEVLTSHDMGDLIPLLMAHEGETGFEEVLQQIIASAEQGESFDWLLQRLEVARGPQRGLHHPGTGVGAVRGRSPILDFMRGR